jgi:hypothetical protein
MSYFFVYVLARPAPQRPFCAFVNCDSFESAIETRKVVLEAAADSLLYLSNVKEGTHAEREARGEIPEQLPPRAHRFYVAPPDSHEPLHGHVASHAHVPTPGNAEVCAVSGCGYLAGNVVHGRGALHVTTQLKLGSAVRLVNFGPECAPEDGGPDDMHESRS